MTPRAIRRAAERTAAKLTRKAEVSEAQLTANQTNAQLSTGPKTESGKATSSLNAVKTGLTGRTVLLSSGEAALYQQHVEGYQNHFQPRGPEESALVQSLADTQWRLNRIPGLELGIYAVGFVEYAPDFDELDESLRAGLVEAQTYLAYEKDLRNLHLQEARLVRRREKETAELNRLQQARRQEEARALDAAAQLYQSAQRDGQPFTPAEFGFEFSTADVQRHIAAHTSNAPPRHPGLHAAA